MQVLYSPNISEAERRFVNLLPTSFDTDGEVLYKGRNTVKRFVIEGKPLIAKGFKAPNIFQRISYSWFSPNKAEKAFLFATRLKGLGILTPNPIAAITCRSKSVVQCYYLVTENCDWPSFWALHQEHSGNDKLVQALAAHLIKMHEAGFLHGDTNLSNFLYNPNDCNQICVIDINRSTFKQRSATRKECLQNMWRLTHNRQLLLNIITAYANLRGWDAQACFKDVEKKLKRFEMRKKILHFGKKRK